MKSKLTQTSSEKALSQNREGKEDTSSYVKREITRLIASKLSIASVQKLSRPLTGIAGLAGITKLYDRYNAVSSQPKIIVRNKDGSKSIDSGRQVRSQSMKILATEKETMHGSKLSSIRLEH
jgi:hypothetical protein